MTQEVPAWFLLLIALTVSWAAIGLRLRFAHRGLDAPNHRSLHDRPTPHGGGLGITAAMLVTGAWLGVPWLVLACVLGLALLSWLDDVLHLPYLLRLTVHLAAAALLCSEFDVPAVWAWPVMILAIGWMTNLYNFMDGADGLAGSMGVIGFAAYGLGFGMAGVASLALWCGAIAVACLGFLRFNWPPARIFMGDVGSIPLGFLAGGLGMWGIVEQAWPAWFPLLVFSPFVLDATVTLGRRALAGKRVWEAHREHYYQRMVRMGYGHRGMTLRWGALMLAVAASALGLVLAPPTVVVMVLAAWVLIFVWLARVIDRRWQVFAQGATQ
jgi:UDP-N-acetylmuramyl pentapeptide phosphotransferase/UDP-N-acetylglucosamine-1-phosphate transferase